VCIPPMGVHVTGCYRKVNKNTRCMQHLIIFIHNPLNYVNQVFEVQQPSSFLSNLISNLSQNIFLLIYLIFSKNVLLKT